MFIGNTMVFTLTHDELIQHGQQVREFRSLSVASLYGVYSDRSRPAELLGSGTFIRHRDDIFILTAMHVVEQSKKYDYVFHDIGRNGESMFPCKSGWTGWCRKTGDLALWGCFCEAFNKSCLRPIPLVEPFGVTNARDDAFFIASGWPEEQSFSLPALREYYTSLHTVMGRKVLRKNIPDYSFAFDCANNIKYFGMSGSAVWDLNLHQYKTTGEWTPKMSTFAGVVTQWDTEGFIIATHAKKVKKFLSGAAERLREQWRQDMNTGLSENPINRR